jgi:multiple sugar transport system substrate-binding protein
MKRLSAALLLAAGCAGAEGGSVTALRLSTWDDPVEMAIDQSHMYGFARSHRGVDLRLDGLSSQAEYRDHVLDLIGGGTPPDVILVDGADVPAFLDGRALLNLTPFLRRLDLDLSRYDSTALATFRRGDAVYALPKAHTPMVLVYNKDLFDAAGLGYPTDEWTWDDFMLAARALTRDVDGDGEVDQWGTYLDPRTRVWLPWIWSGGGDVLCRDGRRASGCLDDRKTVAAFEFLAGWVRRDSIAPRVYPPRDPPDDHLRMFASGKVAMLTAGHFWIPELDDLARGRRVRMGFAPIPHKTGERAATVIYTSGFAVPATVPHRRLSVELAAFMAGRTPAPDREWDAVSRRASATGRSSWGARIERWREVEALLPDVLERAILGGEPVESAARAVAWRVDEVLTRP